MLKDTYKPNWTWQPKNIKARVGNILEQVHANTGAHWTEKDFFVTIPFSNAHVHVLASISSIYVTPRPDILTTNLDDK